MNTAVVIVALFALTVSGAPDGSPIFKPAPVYKPADQFVADQPAFSPEPAKPTASALAAPSVAPASAQDAHNVYNADQGYVDPYSNYDAGYGVQNGYEGYLVPSNGYYPLATTGNGGIFNYIWGLLPQATTVLHVAAKAAVVLLGVAGVVVVGGLAVFGICTFTPYCHISLAGLNAHTIKEEVRSFITPDRISTVARFVRDAIEKYQKMQVNEKIH